MDAPIWKKESPTFPGPALLNGKVVSQDLGVDKKTKPKAPKFLIEYANGVPSSGSHADWKSLRFDLTHT